MGTTSSKCTIKVNSELIMIQNVSWMRFFIATWSSLAKPSCDDPDDMEAFETDNLTISIPCDGSPQPVCKWTKDGGNIDTKDGHFTIKQDGSTYNLIIKEVKPEDAGEYQVEFTNRAGEKKTSLALNVHCKFLEGVFSLLKNQAQMFHPLEKIEKKKN